MANDLVRQNKVALETSAAQPSKLSEPINYYGDDEDPEGENQLTVTSLSGKPLLAKAIKSIKPAKGKTPVKQKFKKDTEAELEALRKRFVPPDGGYGWFIAFGAFLVQFWVAGLIKSYGVIFLEVMEMFPDASASLASWIPAILATLSLALAPVTSILCQRFTCRAVVFTGGLCCCLGLTLSYFANSLIQLLFTFGVLTGIGAGLSTTPGVIITSRYFNKRRAFANGICVSGTAAGSIVLPTLLEQLVPEFGFRGTILILGACMLHVCLSAALYRPMEVHQRIVERSQPRPELEPREDPPLNLLQVPQPFVRSLSEDSGSVYSELKVPGMDRRSTMMMHSVEDLSTDSTCFYKDTKSTHGSVVSLRVHSPPPANVNKKEQQGTVPSWQRYIDLTLVKNPLFLMMAASVMLMAVGCPHMLFYLPSYVSSLGYSKTDAGLLISISSFVDLSGRLLFGFIADLPWFSKHKGYMASIFLSGVAVLCLPFATSFTALTAIVCCYGFGLGCWFLLIPVLLSEYHGTEAIASSYGLVRLFQGTMTLGVPPFAGFLKDQTGSYVSAFFFMGAAMVLGSLVLLWEPCAKRYVDSKKESQTDRV